MSDEKKAKSKSKTEAKAAVFTVAKGKSITSLRGVLAGEVKATDFAGGEKTLKELVDKKLVVKS